MVTRDGLPGAPLSAELLLRPTVRHPPLRDILTDDVRTAMQLTIIRDNDGTPVDCLHVHGHTEVEEIHLLQKAIWEGVAEGARSRRASVKSVRETAASRSRWPSCCCSTTWSKRCTKPERVRWVRR